MASKIKIGVICSGARTFSDYITDQLPEHPDIKYIMISRLEHVLGKRFHKVIHGYDYGHIELSIRLEAYKKVYK